MSAADQIRGGSATSQDSLALGYYRPPGWGLQFAALPAVADTALLHIR